MPPPPQRSEIRLLDASINRAAEGIRTVEEVARFLLDEAALTQTLKSIRHDLQTAIATLPRNDRLSARDTAGDVGTTAATDAEYDRPDVASVVAAAAGRVTESLRVIEEIGKTISGASVGLGASVENLRYRFYDAAAAVELAVTRNDRRRRLADAAVYGLVDTSSDGDAFAARLRHLYAAGVDVLQLRDKSVDDDALWRHAVIGAAIAAEVGKLWIINDRADIAVASGADGVHVGQDELPPRAVRTVVGHDRLIGLSTHNLDQVQSSLCEPVDYIGCGPVFPSRTKAFDSHTGVAWLAEVARTYPRPAFAIGGIDQTNVDQIFAAGIGRVAVTAVLDGDVKGFVERCRRNPPPPLPPSEPASSEPI